MKYEFHYQVGDEIRTVALEESDGHWRAQVDGRALTLAVVNHERNRLLVEVDNQRLLAHIVHGEKRLHLHMNGETWSLQPTTVVRGRRRSAGDSAGGSLTATMPGRVLDVLATPGDAVQKGDTLVVLEAMKMELRMAAPAAGRVKAVHCQAGQVVERGQLLVEVET